MPGTLASRTRRKWPAPSRAPAPRARTSTSSSVPAPAWNTFPPTGRSSRSPGWSRRRGSRPGTEDDYAAWIVDDDGGELSEAPQSGEGAQPARARRDLGRRVGEARARRDHQADPPAGGDRARDPRRRRALPRRHDDLLRRADAGIRDLEPGPLVWESLLSKADRGGPDPTQGAADRELVEVRAGADFEADQGDVDRPVHDDGLVVQRALSLARSHGDGSRRSDPRGGPCAPGSRREVHPDRRAGGLRAARGAFARGARAGPRDRGAEGEDDHAHLLRRFRRHLPRAPRSPGRHD